MKLLHIADLHIGKRVNEFSMIEDQKYILDQIIKITKEEKPAGILIAGDVYDKSQPSAEAVELLDEFLTKLVSLKLPVFIISGNHDSPERLNFGSRILKENNLYIAGVFEGEMIKKVLTDEFGNVNVYMLPFVKPVYVRPYFEKNLETYEDAIKAIFHNTEVRKNERNILVAHQFVTAAGLKPEQSESEITAVGGVDQIDAVLFEDFDYVALGHLHGPQKILRNNIRYAGSPLKYSFSEVKQRKAVTVLELGNKGELDIRFVPLHPMRDMREIKGPIAQLLKIQEQENSSTEDYIRAILTDEEDIYDALGKLRQVYPNLMNLIFENSRTLKETTLLTSKEEIRSRNPVELFADFYLGQNQEELSDQQKGFMQMIVEKAGGMKL